MLCHSQRCIINEPCILFYMYSLVIHHYKFSCVHALQLTMYAWLAQSTEHAVNCRNLTYDPGRQELCISY